MRDHGSGEDFFYHQDDLFSVYAMTDEDGVVVERYEYGDYGQVSITAEDGTPRAASSYGNRHTFTGRLLCDELTLDDGGQVLEYRHRYMMTGSGRFVQRDPAAESTIVRPGAAIAASLNAGQQLQRHSSRQRYPSFGGCPGGNCGSNSFVFTSTGGTFPNPLPRADAGYPSYVDIVNLYNYVHSNPHKFADPSGQVPAALIGCLGGGALSGGARGLSCWLSSEANCARKAACAAAAGCIAGGIAAQFPSTVGACIGSVLGSVAETLCNAAFGDPVDACAVMEAVLASAIGCIGGALPADNIEDSIRGALIGAFPGLLGGCPGKLDDAMGDPFCP